MNSWNGKHGRKRMVKSIIISRKVPPTNPFRVTYFYSPPCGSVFTLVNTIVDYLLGIVIVLDNCRDGVRWVLGRYTFYGVYVNSKRCSDL